MKSKTAIILLAAIICIATIVGATAYAQNAGSQQGTTNDFQVQGDIPPSLTTGAPTYQYVAKFACGSAPNTINTYITPGDYRTVINIHNPQSTNVSIKKKIVIASAEEPRNPIAPIWSREGYRDLQPDYAFRMDCPDIYKIAGVVPGLFIEGFVVLFPSPAKQIDVTALYTASPDANSGISTMEIETIRPKISVPATTSSYVDNPP